jgi:hypothetical protein
LSLGIDYYYFTYYYPVLVFFFFNTALSASYPHWMSEVAKQAFNLKFAGIEQWLYIL